MLPVTQILKYAISLGKDGGFLKKDIPRYVDNMPPVIVWNLTNHCNMTCPHCYASAKIRKPEDDLSLDQLISILDKLSEFGVKIIILSGGEPLLRNDIFEIIQECNKRNIKTHLSTNGSLIDADTAKKLKESGIEYVGVSIDGEPEFNDNYRGLESAYEKALTGLKNAKEFGMSTGLRMTLTKKNSDSLIKMIETAREHEIPRFYISHLVYGGRGKAYAVNDLEKQESKNIMNLVIEKSLEIIDSEENFNIITGGNDADGVYVYQYCKENFAAQADDIWSLLKKRNGNSAAEKILNVDYKGNVHPDQFWQNETLGNLLNNGLRDILQNKLIAQLKERTKYLKGKCKACDYVEICRGSHRERALAAFNDIWAEDPACYI
ncbi:MAG: radical SAM protein [Spirochaetia bacterium]|nr:radical SAM protein [Spirochaetia bacterium]